MNKKPKVFSAYTGKYKIYDIVVWSEGLHLEVGAIIDIEDSTEESNPNLALAVVMDFELDEILKIGKDVFFDKLNLAERPLKHLPYDTNFALVQLTSNGVDKVKRALENNNLDIFNIAIKNEEIIKQLNLSTPAPVRNK
jgi:hypothetical protein